MVFLLEYDRNRGRLVQLKEYVEEDRPIAEQERLALELQLHRQGITHEVVILEAESVPALRKTHRRYFESVAELTRRNGDD